MISDYIPNTRQGVVQKLPSLLHMEYKPSELAREIGVSTKTIYTKYIPAGLPHRKDVSGNIWIIGTDFADWLTDRISMRPPKIKLKKNEGWCARCKQPRVFETMQKKNTLSAGRASYVGPCSVCGLTMTVIRRTKDIPNDQP